MATDGINQQIFSGHIIDVTTTVAVDGSVPLIKEGRQGDQFVGDAHGKHYTISYRGRAFEANAVNVTVPVIAASLASVFALVNPPSSGVNAELVDVTLSQWMVTAVVDQVGWYYSPVTKLFAGTFTTTSNPNNSVVGNNSPNKTLFYSSYAHSGTPTLVDVVGSWGATSNVSNAVVTKFYDGRLILPPGNVISLAMATAAGTTTGLDVECRWCEWPV